MRYALIIILLWPIIVLADNGHGHDHGGDVDVANSITGGDVSLDTGDVSISDSTRSYGFAYGMGDVDINQCLASTQWGTILVSRQKVVLNKWCAAESYDARGLHFMAALLRCDIDEVIEHFESKDECVKANTYRPPEPEPAPAIIIPAVPVEVEEEHDNLEQRLVSLERSQRAAAIKAQQRREVAQETYEKVKELRNDERDH